MIVDGFDSWFTNSDNPKRTNNDFTIEVGKSLNRFGISFDTVDNLVITKSKDTGRTVDQEDYFNLDKYSVIVYMLGEEGIGQREYSLNFLEEEAIADYLDNGGKLFISGSNLAEDLTDIYSDLDNINLNDVNFYKNYLKVDSWDSTDANTHTIESGTGIFLGIPQFNIGNSNPYDVDSPDKINSAAANTILTYSNGGTAAIEYENLVYLAFPIESVTSQTIKEQIIGKILVHFGMISSCGDNSCDASETIESCPEDCTEELGCTINEDCKDREYCKANDCSSCLRADTYCLDNNEEVPCPNNGCDGEICLVEMGIALTKWTKNEISINEMGDALDLWKNSICE